MDNLWTLRWFYKRTGFVGCAVPPSDDSNSADAGLLVYRSEEAAQLAAEHQTDLYGSSDMVVQPVRLSEFLASCTM